ncbi:hypothetical protein HI914_01826, partial [Erysiphe necator]
MDSAPHLKYVIDLLRRSPHMLTREIADRFTEEFEETFRMVAQPENHRSPMEILNDLKQGPLESVMNYFTKSQGVLHQLGVNKSNQQDPNSSTMRSLVIEMITSKFLTGLNDDRLRARSIERGAASAKALEESFRIIKNVEKSMIDERKQMLLQKKPGNLGDSIVSEILEEFAQQTYYNTEHSQTVASYHGKNRPRRRQVEPLINTRIKDGPLDYMKILDKTKVEISLKDLAQMSPAARKHWKHGMSRINDKRSRKKRRQAEISEVALKLPIEETQTDGSKKETRASPLEKSSAPQQIMTYKSFRVNAKVETVIAGKKKIILLDINSTHVDQGADLNLISDYLAKILKFQTIKLPKPILFGTAEGRLTNATHFTKIRIGVSGVWRFAEALVLPPASGNPCSIILSLPWLFDVCGNLDIPTFTLKIGDITKGEKRVEVQTTQFKLGQNSRLRLMLADQKTIELARAQIVARDSQSKISGKHVQFLSESESDDDYEESLLESDRSSEDSASSGKDCVAGESLCQNPKMNSETSTLGCQNIVFDYHNLDCYGNPLLCIHDVMPIIETFTPINTDDISCSKLAAFPTNRRPKVRTLSNDPNAVIEKWFSE